MRSHVQVVTACRVWPRFEISVPTWITEQLPSSRGLVRSFQGFSERLAPPPESPSCPPASAPTFFWAIQLRICPESSGVYQTSPETTDSAHSSPLKENTFVHGRFLRHSLKEHWRNVVSTLGLFSLCS